MGKKLKSHFDLLKPNIAIRVEQKQQQQKHNHDSHAVPRQFQEGDVVYARDFRQGQTWLTGQIVKCLGPVLFKIMTDDGHMIRHH